MVSATELCEYWNPYQILRAGLQNTFSSITLLVYTQLYYTTSYVIA